MPYADDPLDHLPTGPLTPAADVPTAPEGVLAVGETVAGRYRVKGFLGRGGMGEVYEADDVELGVTVALKTMRVAAGRDAAGVSRLKSEVLLARKVTHPNVCRIFDFGQHVHDGVPLTFLTMERLEGETLAARLAREGALAPERALPLLREMASGLAAAHAAGVVHGDFKPANILVVPHEGRERAVVTDFGVARHVGESGPVVGGTVAYMAREQLRGEPPTTAADIHALGVVLYEMVTGRLPGRPPVPARQRVPSLGRAWDAAIRRCLADDPAQRFASPLDVVEAVAPASRRWSVPLGAAVLAFAAVAAALIGLRAPETSPATSRPSVAVLGFRNLSGREASAWLSPALAEMLATELAAGEQVRLVAGEDVARMKADLGLDDASTLAPQTLARVRRRLGSDMVVTGSYLAVDDGGGLVRLDLRVQDVASGETIAAVAEEGTQARLLDLVRRSGRRLRTALALPPVQSDAQSTAAQPRTPEAARLYVEGLARLHAFDARGAQETLERAAAADAEFAPVHAALAEAWMVLGADDRAAESARRAKALGGALPREQRLAAEGLYHEAVKDWPAAIGVYEALARFFPDDLQHALRLARARTAGGAARQALEELDRVRALPGVADSRVDIEEAVAAEALGDFPRQIAAAGRALELARAEGDRLVAAHALQHQAWAWRNLGDPERALQAAQEAGQAFEAVGDLRAAGRARNTRASLLFDAGRMAEAQALFERNLADARALGDRREIQRGLANAGLMLLHRGRLAEARALYEESLPLARAIGNRVAEARLLNNLAEVPYLQDRLDEARRLDEEALRIAKEAGNEGLVANVHYDLGDVFLAAGRRREARREHERALELREALRETGTAVESRLALAGLALDDGDAATAETLARRALQDAVAKRRRDNQALAHARLALALAAMGRGEEARQEIGKGRGLAAQSEVLALRLDVALGAGQVLAAADRVAARAVLDEALAEAGAAGFARHARDLRRARSALR